MAAEQQNEEQDVAGLMHQIGRTARQAGQELALTSSEARTAALRATADELRKRRDAIKAANARDLEEGRDKGLSRAMMDRLTLDDDRIEGMAAGVETVADLNDPVGRELNAWEQPNGLRIARVAVPLGVIGVIYESRPNVTADAAALALKAGNACILRGGSESFHSSRAILTALENGMEAGGLPRGCVQMVPTRDRAAVGEMLKMSEHIDVIVPRGGRSLIERITRESHIPLFKHLEGICHTYVDSAADADKAVALVHNAKLRRTGICGATETLLVARSRKDDLLPAILDDLHAAGCEIRGTREVMQAWPGAHEATEADWDTEYLDAILSVKVVDGVDEAMAHIRRHSSSHTEAVVTEDAWTADRFLAGVDSAIVMHNASTQFADGGEFGMGAEIGISTGRMHARGPVGVDQLTIYKYVVRGSGQVRP